MKPQIDWFSFIFWRKLKTQKRHFEINWPLTEHAFLRAKSLQSFRHKIVVKLLWIYIFLFDRTFGVRWCIFEMWPYVFGEKIPHRNFCTTFHLHSSVLSHFFCMYHFSPKSSTSAKILAIINGQKQTKKKSFWQV